MDSGLHNLILYWDREQPPQDVSQIAALFLKDKSALAVSGPQRTPAASRKKPPIKNGRLSG